MHVQPVIQLVSLVSTLQQDMTLLPGHFLYAQGTNSAAGAQDTIPHRHKQCELIQTSKSPCVCCVTLLGVAACSMRQTKVGMSCSCSGLVTSNIAHRLLINVLVACLIREKVSCASPRSSECVRMCFRKMHPARALLRTSCHTVPGFFAVAENSRQTSAGPAQPSG